MTERESLFSGEGADGDRQARRQEMTERVSGLVADVGLDPTIARAYLPEGTDLYVYSGMAPTLSARLDQAKLDSLREFQELYDEAYARRFQDPRMQEMVRSVRRSLGTADRPADDERLLVELARESDFDSDIAEMVSDDYFGLRRSPPLRQVIQANYIHYFWELPASDMVLPDSGLLDDIRNFTYGDDQPGFPPRASGVAMRLLAMGLRDLSKPHLDERRASLSAIAQFEAAGLLLNDLAFLPVLKPSTGTRTANALANRYRQALVSDDYAGKVALAREVANIFQQYGRQIRSRQARQFVTFVARDASAIARDLRVMRQFFRTVYDRLGYEQPVAASEDHTASKLGGVAVRSEVPGSSENAPDEDAVRRGATTLATQWRLGSRERRARGFAPIQQALVTGELETGAEEHPVPAVPKEQARQLVDVLAHLHDLVTTLPQDEVQERLTAAVGEQRRLLTQVRELNETARARGRRTDPVNVVPIRELIERLRSNWPTYRELVLRTWPERRGAEVASLLDPLLSTPRPSEPDSPP